MSLVTDSPVHSSSSSDDFAAFLDSTLDSKSSDSSPDENAVTDGHSDSSDSSSDEEAEDDCNLISKRPRVEKLESIEETQGSTSNGFVEQQLRETEGSTSNGFLELPLGETQESTSDVFVEQPLEASWKKDMCKHPGSFGEMCILCGQMLDTESGVTLRYIHKELRLCNDEIVRLRATDMKNLLRRKKLYLVLDLDHTLLNSTQLIHLTVEEEYLKEQTDSLQDVSEGSLFKLQFMHMMTKLRPFVRTFLKEASEMFEMYIYTMGDRSYALEMAKLLDPRKEYFDSRIISRDDGTEKHQKGLDVVLGQDSAVLILDDTENAWTKHKDNLILMERYHFFASSCRQFGFNCKSLSELKSDESEFDGALSSVLKVLRRIHSLFFDELGDNVDGRDARQVLKTVRKEVLKNCKLVFSRVFPTKFQAEKHHFWKMAEQLGASCSTELDQTVTHVVSTDAGTEKSRWAVKEQKFLVHPTWIEATNYMWQRQPEENFTLDQIKNQ
ncbi:RNA polymerase II ctd phosphatase putative isoform 1 [Tripterygium wilfordii]|uniref:RNA polymerase II C-terminal domain phosphatase-like n=1 Tax=Tripterygium wilfordii TaxID=458696 RepID=A0A7J7BVH3_TRIWF|nr:RNA polymerase II C-terminal domain phosphatase-like 4 [Tripterygium wilfordii]XP_038697082.1 RNA polymerase II C-terminal domain phosphatase-like 4 [Tripterygium wilfordii]XP_038697083.1 RNA polymerase II C-terminal domain phosphatase-like 4 [Tripterygium wilfordii]KAF5725871.1 RNA polymerase II ctd phosphatase putative isoform 1 [Tripterygium wilfordii]